MVYFCLRTLAGGRKRLVAWAYSLILFLKFDFFQNLCYNINIKEKQQITLKIFEVLYNEKVQSKELLL